MPAFSSSFNKKKETDQQPLLGVAWIESKKGKNGEFQVINARLDFAEVDKYATMLKEKGESIEHLDMELTEVRERKDPEKSPHLVIRIPYKYRKQS